MSKDKFDEYFLTLTQAKNQEKLGLDSQALETYLHIIDTYTLDTDFAYERAVVLLEKNNDYERAKTICELALEKIRHGTTKGNVEFYDERLGRLVDKIKLTQSSSPNESPLLKALPRYLRKNSSLAIGAGYLVFAIALSFPNKWSKFGFIILLPVFVIFLIEVLKGIQRNVFLKLQSAISLLSFILVLVFAALIPPPEWAQFLSLESLTQNQASQSLTEVTEKTAARGTKEPVTSASDGKSGHITAEDLTTLEKLIEKSYIIVDYELIMDENRMDLTVYFATGVTAPEAKTAVAGLLGELNTIKGFEAADGKMGGLFKYYSVSIKGYDSFGATLINGQVNRASQKLVWR